MESTLAQRREYIARDWTERSASRQESWNRVLWSVGDSREELSKLSAWGEGLSSSVLCGDLSTGASVKAHCGKTHGLIFCTVLKLLPILRSSRRGSVSASSLE